MENKLYLPAGYAVLSDDEMTASSNTKGNLFTVLGKAFDDIGADMSKSAANFVRDGVSTAMVIALAPLSAILLVVK